jgi:hypothetical protein
MHLTTTRDVLKALGGVKAVMELTKTKRSRAANWVYKDTFPQRFHFFMTRELEKRGHTAPPELWGQYVG